MDDAALTVEQLDALSRAVPEDAERRDLAAYLAARPVSLPYPSPGALRSPWARLGCSCAQAHCNCSTPVALSSSCGARRVLRSGRDGARALGRSAATIDSREAPLAVWMLRRVLPEPH